MDHQEEIVVSAQWSGKKCTGLLTTDHWPLTTMHYDAIIIGAGHNGLVTAAYLAKAGERSSFSSAATSSAGPA